MRTEDFIRGVRDAGAPGDKEAERWVTAVLVALGHLLPDSETRRHFASQLPGRFKSQLLAEVPRGLVMNREAFSRHLGAALDVHAAEAERVLHAVYGVLKQAVSPGEIADFEAHLPKEIAALLARG